MDSGNKDRKSIPKYGSLKYRLLVYNRRKEANKGYNFEYWNDEKHGQLLGNGYKIYKFDNSSDSTAALGIAKNVVFELRNKGNYARIICGYSKNIQRIKMFSVIYKPRK